ncbi:MAG TPA: adenylate/guanylate cyclase domain-containing protein [Candidatus Limnocylindria bacterium]|nr:adenylate/guanylate cyclase domain-containing protein [Candidatus Limnocylindria bacterium]
MAERATKTKATCATCGGTIRAKDRFCPTCGTPIAAAQAARSATTSASLQVTAETADALLEQRKVVTIVFADLSGSTPLAEKLDPEELRGILGSYFGALARQIQRYEGTIDKYIGDAVMAVFGAPISHEDDAERAVHAALAMQASIVRLNDDLDRTYGVRLSLRIGVNTGEVVAGLLAGDVQRAYTVVGDAVNTAQRLESAAPLGQVLVSETTRRLAMHRFEFERRDPIVLKGKTEPVVTYRVVRELDTTIEPDATRFVGRAEELAVLGDALGRARAGRGSVISIVGEPGVGKSRLIAEFRNALPPQVDRMTARCASYEQATPYALIADFIRGAFGIHAADDETAASAALQEGLKRYAAAVDPTVAAVVLEIIGYPERSAVDPERKRALLVGFLRSVLQRAAARAPFLLAAEDLHWGDDASLRVLEELVGDTATLPCLLLTTSRTGWSPRWEAQCIELAPFDDAGGRELIEAVVQMPVEPALADSVLARTGGNPFFIEEVVRELQSAGSLVERAGRIGADAKAAERLPATITEVLEARLDRLSEPATRVVRPAAVIGRTFWYRVLAQLLPEGSVSEGLGILESEQFVVARATTPELTYAFRQALIRDVAYQVQLMSVRRRTHTAVGRAIETLFSDRLDEFIDLLAYHYERGDEPVRALPWLMRAADRAKSLFANEEALGLYASALERAADGDGPYDAGTVLERRGDVQTLMGRYDDALASLAASRERGTPAPARIARLERLSGVALAKKGEYDQARASYQRGLAIFGGADDAEACRVGLQLGQLLWRRGDYDGARIALVQALAAGERLGAVDVLAEGTKQLGNVAYLEGDLRLAGEMYRRSQGQYEKLGDTAGIADIHSNLGALAARQGHWDEALAEHETSLTLRRLMGNPWGVGTCLNNIGEMHRARGDAAQAAAAFEQAIATWTPIAYASGVAIALIGLGAARIEAGDVEAGTAHLRDAERRFDAVGSTTYHPDIYRYLAGADLANGDLAAAKANAERSLAFARAAGAAAQAGATERVLGQIALAQGDRADARHHLQESKRVLEEAGDAAELARTEAVLRSV